MSAHGIKTVYFWALDDNGKVLTGDKGLSQNGIYEANGTGEGFTAANVTGLEVEGTQQYANDVVKRVSYGKAQPKVALTALDLNHDILMKMKGYVKDSKGGYVKGLKKPHIAMLIVSTSLADATIHSYEGLANTEVVEEASNHSTDTNTEADADTTLSASVMNPLDPTVFVDPNDSTHQEPYKIWFSDEAGFDLAAVMKEVGGGWQAVNAPSGQNTMPPTNND